jgi:hypothetical protein
MKGRKIPTNQYEIYANSVHGEALLENGDIGAPSCNDCHGNHGASPPGVSSVTHLCGTCHVNNMEFFRTSLMARTFEELDFHGCAQCHGHHSIERVKYDFVGTTQSSFCVKCHEEGDPGYKTAEIISAHLNNLVALYDSANAMAREVKIKGMNDVDIEYLLKDVKQSLIQSRTLVHTFDTIKIRTEINNGVNASLEALKFADNEIEEYYSRRYGFGFATLIFLFFAVILFIKIKSLEK